MSIPSALPTPGGVAIPNLETIMGPLVIGTIFATALWGVICVQTYDYFIDPNMDPLWQKWVVALLCFLGTLDTVMNTHTVYYYLVINFANPYEADPAKAVWSASTRSLIVAISTFIVRTVFIRRIYLVSSKNITLTSLIMFISTADVVIGVVGTIKSFFGLTPDLNTLLYGAFSTGVASDLSVTLALSSHLYSMKSGLRKTNSLVKVLILYIVTTGLLVVIDATLMLVFHIVMRENWIFYSFYLVLGKLYISSYLASLNAREGLRKDQTDMAITISRMSYQNRKPTVTTTDDSPSSHHSTNPTAITLRSSIEHRTNDYDLKNLSSAHVV